ncbi:Stk1 family PASTA domain-containing Ser/Thr kinase [Luteipulveratus sp. YIM 133132]|uniref:Stk1 family PASTA domain-containing Ser/Thr kinase n=1 Tax=Luteipulveratus flavus TaxID=3031728 RepID=UPI0023AFEE3E|nr:Stk1 family PASTA domain-containing Ser/Thr kinase [Luteipulveratus sp. YIM 133132]MDE9366768.1 Stk1 family PASTA domain-containing Ser/Thr kinase [Luteipulveratus sp. YIM 133132]
MSKVASSSLVGRVIDGRYRVVSHHADGGMASVFVAVDERLDREIALKVMRADLSRDEAFVARFRREARSAARLSHPHVVSVYDQGQDGTYVFLVMELVRGRTLRDVIRADAPLTARAALDIFEVVLRALAAAHGAGLIHRDVKPENVLISEDGSVKVADFGLARAVTTDTLTTNSDVLLGTAAYLSPEQVEHGTVDQRSDVYSAGLVLFEMLTGEKAYAGDSPIHVAYQHVHGAVPRPSDAVAGIPTELDDLVALASAKDPTDRPENAAAMLQEVHRTRARLDDDTLDGRPEPASPPARAGTVTPTRAIRRTGATDPLRRPPVGAGPARPHTGPDRRVATARTGGPPRGMKPVRAAGPGGPRPGGARRAGSPDRRTGWWIAAAVAVLVAITGSGAAWWFTAGPGGARTVPNVVGVGRGSAVRTIDEAGLPVQVREVFSETVARDSVVRTVPGAGADQRRSEAVVVEVSKGPERYLVPTLPGVSQAAAEQRLTSARLARGTVTQAYSETVASGLVVSSRPGTGAELRKGAKVDLVVSKGREPITVPVVTDQPQASAATTITDAGLTVSLAPQEFSDTVPQGNVIRQSPGSGTLFRGGQVQLVVSKGPQMVTVPRVVDQSTGQARRTLQDAGLKVKVKRLFGGLFDTVRDQDPAPGTSVPRGTEVTVSVV